MDPGKRHRDGALRNQLMGLRPDLICADPKLSKGLGDAVGLDGEGAIARHLFAGFKHKLIFGDQKGRFACER